MKDSSTPRNLLLCDKLFTDVGCSPHITTLVFSAIHTQLNSYVFSGLTVESGRPPLFAIYGFLSDRNYYAQCSINIVQDSSVVVEKRLRAGLPRQGYRFVSSPKRTAQLRCPSSEYQLLFARAEALRAQLHPRGMIGK